MDASDRTKLTKILGLLGSEHGGERASAALMATKFLAKRSLTWSDVISGPASNGSSSKGSGNSGQRRTYERYRREQQDQHEQPGKGDHRYEKANTSALYFRKVNWLQANANDLMSDWEKSFIESVIVRTIPLSYKQRVVVDGLIEKAKAFGREFN